MTNSKTVPIVLMIISYMLTIVLIVIDDSTYKNWEMEIILSINEILILTYLFCLIWLGLIVKNRHTVTILFIFQLPQLAFGLHFGKSPFAIIDIFLIVFTIVLLDRLRVIKASLTLHLVTLLFLFFAFNFFYIFFSVIFVINSGNAMQINLGLAYFCPFIVFLLAFHFYLKRVKKISLSPDSK